MQQGSWAAMGCHGLGVVPCRSEPVAVAEQELDLRRADGGRQAVELIVSHVQRLQIWKVLDEVSR
jgi:hypothetical protein